MIITFEQYQIAARRTYAPTAGRDLDFAIAALGLTGESGEVADVIKKHVGHGHPLDLGKLSKEIGDCLFYLSRLADLIGVPLAQLAAENEAKLRARYPEGFSTEASIARVDVVKP